MGAFSIWHWLIVLVVVVVLFGGGGKVSQLMGDFGKGLRVFKKNIKDKDDEQPSGHIPDESSASVKKETSSSETTS